MHAETTLTAADLIWPLFIAEGQGVEEPIASLPGVSRWSVDGIVTRAKEARDLGIREVVVAGAADDELLPALVAYFCAAG